VGWATTYYQLTYETNRERGRTASGGEFSNIFSPSWTYNQINYGRNADTTLLNAYNLLSKNGAANAAEFPYSVDDVLPENYQGWSTDPAVWRNAINSALPAPARLLSAETVMSAILSAI
jgi:hypothetical protein